MPRTYARFQSLKIKGNFTSVLDEKLQVILRKAARAYIRALITQVPVWTGMALGSVKFARGPGGFLAQYLNIAIPIVPHPKAKVRSYKNAAAGGRLGSYDFTSSRHIYRFKLRSDVVHYILNEFFARPPGVNEQIVAPWQSQEHGLRAFQDTVTSELAKLPKVLDFAFNEEPIVFGA
jgi:hypothetical protein